VRDFPKHAQDWTPDRMVQDEYVTIPSPNVGQHRAAGPWFAWTSNLDAYHEFLS
jgi:hypothetical protein